MLIVIVRWFRGVPQSLHHDAELHTYLAEVAGYLRELSKLESEGKPERARLDEIDARLVELKADLLSRYPSLNLEDPKVLDVLLGSVRDAGQRLHDLERRDA